MATILSPSSQIALRAAVSTFCGEKWDVNSVDVLDYVRRKFPIMGPLVERTDISRALRAMRFRRDRAAGPDAWMHEKRDHPRFGRGAADARGYLKAASL